MAYAWEWENSPWIGPRLGRPGPIWEEMPDETVRRWVHISVAANLLLDRMIEIMEGHVHVFRIYDKGAHESREQAEEIEALSYADAAERWARRMDLYACEGAIGNGDAKAVLQIRIEDSARWESYTVSGETVVRYTVRKGEW